MPGRARKRNQRTNCHIRFVSWHGMDYKDKSTTMRASHPAIDEAGQPLQCEMQHWYHSHDHGEEPVSTHRLACMQAMCDNCAVQADSEASVVPVLQVRCRAFNIRTAVWRHHPIYGFCNLARKLYPAIDSTILLHATCLGSDLPPTLAETVNTCNACLTCADILMSVMVCSGLIRPRRQRFYHR